MGGHMCYVHSPALNMAISKPKDLKRAVVGRENVTLPPWPDRLRDIACNVPRVVKSREPPSRVLYVNWYPSIHFFLEKPWVFAFSNLHAPRPTPPLRTQSPRVLKSEARMLRACRHLMA
jgi:hypothetical protein